MPGSTNHLKVGVKFCGNCNPHLDCPKLLQELIQEARGIRFVHWSETDFDLLLILSACPIDCATRPDFQGPTVIVSGSMVDRRTMSEDLLLNSILEALYRLKEGYENVNYRKRLEKEE
jgi:hypothetical protein